MVLKIKSRKKHMSGRHPPGRPGCLRLPHAWKLPEKGQKRQRVQLDEGHLGAPALKDGAWLAGGDELAELGFVK